MSVRRQNPWPPQLGGMEEETRPVRLVKVPPLRENESERVKARDTQRERKRERREGDRKRQRKRERVRKRESKRENRGTQKPNRLQMPYKFV